MFRLSRFIGLTGRHDEVISQNQPLFSRAELSAANDFLADFQHNQDIINDELRLICRISYPLITVFLSIIKNENTQSNQ